MDGTRQRTLLLWCGVGLIGRRTPPTRRIILEAPDFTIRDEPTHPHPSCGCWWGYTQLAPRGAATDGEEPAARTID
ncbi:MAG: hypothetical protein GY871_03530 [Actinomycetales bacterium]|nr:hypothetical protein [Actinomycetales bacterium]MCP4894654.1 hypothetical protein [Actinomycetales bacterium]